MTQKQDNDDLMAPVKEAANWFLVLQNGSANTLRMMSRMPGSLGPFPLFWFWIYGSVAMTFFCGIILKSNTPWCWWYFYGLFWALIVHWVAWFVFGRGTHRYATGKGWLRLWRDEEWADLASDAAVGLLVIYISWEFVDFGMMIWPIVAFIASVGMHATVATRDELRDRVSLDAKMEADYQVGRISDELEN